MIDLPSLYPHQEELRDRTRTALAKHGRVILCAQTGSWERNEIGRNQLAILERIASVLEEAHS